MWRRSIIVSAIAFGVIGGAVMAIQSPRVAHNLKARVQQLAHEHLGLRVEIAELELELLPPAIRFGGIKVRRPDRSTPWVTLHRGRVQVRPWPSPSGAVVMEFLELDGLEIDHTLGPTADTDFNADLTQLRLPLDIRELLIWNGRMRLRNGDTELINVAAVDIEVRPHDEGGRQIAIDVPVGRFAVKGRSFDVELHSKGRLRGSLDRPESLAVESTRIFLEQIALRSSGQVALSEGALEEIGENAPGMLLTVEGGISLDRLRELLPDLPDVRGDARLKAELKGSPRQPFATPLVRIETNITNAQVMGRTLGTLSANALVEGPRITLESFGVDTPGSGRLTGSGAVDLTDLTVSYAARVHEVFLPAVLAKAGLNDAWIRLNGSGDVQGHGILRPLRVELDGDLNVHSFSILDRSYRDDEAVEVLNLQNVRVAGPAAITSRGLEAGGLRVEWGETKVLGEGFMAFDPDVGFDLRISAEQFDLADLGPLAGIDFAGSGSVFAALEGPYKNPSISGTPHLDDFSVMGYAVGDTKGTVIFEDLRLTVDRTVIRRGRGSIIGGGFIGFDTPVFTVGGDFDISDVDLGGVLQGVGIDAGLARRLDSRVTGVVELEGPLLRPVGRVDLIADDVKLDAIELGRMELGLTLGQAQDEVVRFFAKGRPGGGFLRASVGLREPTTDQRSFDLDVDVKARGLDFDYITPMLGDLPFEGELTTEVALRGPVDRLEGTVSATVSDLVTWGVNMGPTQLQGTASVGTLALSGRTLFDSAGVTANVVLGEQLPFVAQASIRGANIGRSYTLPRGMRLTVDGQVSSQGDLTRPESIIAQARVGDASASLDEFNFALAREAVLLYGAGRLDVVDMGVRGPSLSANVAGRVDGSGLDLGVTATGDLGIITSLVPTFEMARGPFSAKFQIGGTADSPMVEGLAEVQQSQLRLKTLGIEMQNVEGTFKLAGRDIQFREGSATSGGGPVRFSGGILLPAGDEHAQLRLFVDFERVRIRPDPTTRATATGRLSFLGPFADLLIKGSVNIDKMRYAKKLELSVESFFPKKDAPLDVPDFAPGSHVAVDVHIEAPGTISLDAGAVTAQLRASVDLRGNTASMGLGGTITPLWLKAKHRDITFEYESGDISFTEEFRVMARYDLVAKAKACEMDMRLRLTGDSRGIGGITLTGVDDNGPVHEQDPWSCVTYGVRLSQHAGATALSKHTERVTIEDTIGSGLDILWGVSGLDKTVRSIIPYVDEARIRVGSPRRGGKNGLEWRLVLSKEIGNNFQLKYDGAIDKADDHILSVQYDLSDHASMEGSWASDSQLPSGDLGLDLRLEWSFD